VAELVSATRSGEAPAGTASTLGSP
jgi:hypothetical protein